MIYTFDAYGSAGAKNRRVLYDPFGFQFLRNGGHFPARQPLLS